MLAGEEQCGAFPAELGLERGRIAFQLGLEIGVGGLVEQLDGGLEVVGTC
jgi:hypothetical protein